MTNEIEKEFKELPDKIESKAIEIYKKQKDLVIDQDRLKEIELDVTEEVVNAVYEDEDSKMKAKYSNETKRRVEIKKRLNEMEEYKDLLKKIDDQSDEIFFGKEEIGKMKRQFVVNEVLLRLTVK